MSYYAHDGQLLQNHLDEVSALTKLFASKFGAGNIGSLVGLLHDQGKYTHAFQDYLKRSLAGEETRRGEVIHALQGAKFVDDAIADQLISDILGNVIAMHHGGLFDCICEGERTLSHKLKKPEDIVKFQREDVGRPRTGGVD